MWLAQGFSEFVERLKTREVVWRSQFYGFSATLFAVIFKPGIMRSLSRKNWLRTSVKMRLLVLEKTEKHREEPLIFYRGAPESLKPQSQLHKYRPQVDAALHFGWNLF